MTLNELGIIIGQKIEARYRTETKTFAASFDGMVEVKDGSMLEYACGVGKSDRLARAAYAKRLRGQRIVIDAYRHTRREFNIPKTLTA